jgi:hypothetical protein
MKHLGLVHILLLLGIGLFLGPAMAELTASQNVLPSTANVGENVMVTVMLTYFGDNATQATITPGLPPGIETSYPGGQSMELYPGITAPISYPIRAAQSGSYLVTSLVSYSEEGTWRNLRLESPFTAIGQIEPQQQPGPGQETPGGVWPPGSSPYGPNPGGSYPAYPGDVNPGGMNPGGRMPNNSMPNGSMPNNPMGGHPEHSPSSDPNQESGPDQSGPEGQ